MNHTKNKELYYTLRGNEDFLDEYALPRVKDPENENVFAKVIQNKKSKHFNSKNVYSRYYIKTNPLKQILDPLNKLPEPSKQTYHFVHSICKNDFVFTEVSQSIFDKYVRFLQSKDVRWLREAQRELI